MTCVKDSNSTAFNLSVNVFAPFSCCQKYIFSTCWHFPKTKLFSFATFFLKLLIEDLITQVEKRPLKRKSNIAYNFSTIFLQFFFLQFLTKKCLPLSRFRKVSPTLKVRTIQLIRNFV